MQRWLILLLNFALLVLLLIGLPAALRGRVGDLQISTAASERLLMMITFGIAVGLNAYGALFYLKSPKHKILCWEWTGLFAALWLTYLASLHGYINFIWLKRTLLWLQRHL